MVMVPGERVCAAEEFVPGDGLYEEAGEVYAKQVGTPRFDQEERVVSLEYPERVPRLNVPGSIVYGRVSKVLDQFVLVELFPYKTRRFRLHPPSKYAVIHISKVRRGFVKDLRSEFGVGDWVRARIISMEKKFFIQLSTEGRQFGIIKAYCPRDRTPLRRKGNLLYCPRCRTTVRRKIAEDYGNPRVPLR